MLSVLSHAVPPRKCFVPQLEVVVSHCQAQADCASQRQIKTPSASCHLGTGMDTDVPISVSVVNRLEVITVRVNKPASSADPSKSHFSSSHLSVLDAGLLDLCHHA